MKGTISIAIAISSIVWIGACEGSKKSAEEQAKKQAAELEAKSKAQPAQKIRAPVVNEAKIPCTQLVPDPVAYQTALGEADPIEVRDNTQSDAEAAAVCALMKTGAKLTAKEQEALAKKTNHRLGVQAGDKICSVTAYCWTVESEEALRKWCKEKGHRDDESMGSYACVQIIPTGEKDVDLYYFFDEDSKCRIKVNAGPSNTDNDKIRKCAQTARDTIGPDQIRVEAPAPTP